MTIKQLYAGFDTIELAFLGALPKETLILMEEAKKEAIALQDKQLITIGPGNVQGHITTHGLSGGYAYLFDTGPTGELWSFKDNTDPSEWNIAVKVHASALACHSYQETKDQIFQRLQDMGCIYGTESLRRVDFAMDFLMPKSFELNHEQFVAHNRAKVSPYYGEKQSDTQTDENTPSCVFRGRQTESVTIGKMPGRQVIVYDKRKAAIAKRALFWFKVWNVDPKDPNLNIWRVELRAGKKELKNKWGLRTFTDLENSIGDAFTDAIEKIRYLDDFQSDANVTRQRPHPLWVAAEQCLQKNLTDYRSGLLPGQVTEIFFDQHIETRIQQLMGSAAALASAYGLSDEEIREEFGLLIGQTISDRINSAETTFWDSKARAEKRIALIKRFEVTEERFNQATLPPEWHPKKVEEWWQRIAEEIIRRR